MTQTEQLVIELYLAREAHREARRYRNSSDLDRARYLSASRAAATALRRVLQAGELLAGIPA